MSTDMTVPKFYSRRYKKRLEEFRCNDIATRAYCQKFSFHAKSSLGWNLQKKTSEILSFNKTDEVKVSGFNLATQFSK